MPLRFNPPRRSSSPRTRVAGIPLRLVSLVMGLGLVAVVMSTLQEAGTQEKLALLFGDARPVADLPTETTDPERPAFLEALDPAQLETIVDNAPFADEEQDAWFHLLEVVQNATDEELHRASVGEAVYNQLRGQPRVYRGRVVSLTGNVRRIESITPAENNLGIDQLNLVYIQPSRDVMRPFAIYCLDLPEGWTPGTKLPGEGRIACDAIFFKIKVYDHARGVDLMPVFVAKTFTPIASPPPPLVDRTPRMPAWQMVAWAAGLAAVVVGWIVWRGVEPSRPRPVVDAESVASELHALETPEGDQTP